MKLPLSPSLLVGRVPPKKNCSNTYSAALKLALLFYPTPTLNKPRNVPKSKFPTIYFPNPYSYLSALTTHDFTTSLPNVTLGVKEVPQWYKRGSNNGQSRHEVPCKDSICFYVTRIVCQMGKQVTNGRMARNLTRRAL